MEQTSVRLKQAEEDAVTRIECRSKKEKIKYVSCINVEVKDLQLFVKRLSRKFCFSETSLLSIYLHCMLIVNILLVV